jgi:hypothetical protein
MYLAAGPGWPGLEGKAKILVIFFAFCVRTGFSVRIGAVAPWREAPYPSVLGGRRARGRGRDTTQDQAVWRAWERASIDFSDKAPALPTGLPTGENL